MKPLQIIGGITFGLVCTTVDSWPTWAVLLLPVLLGCAVFARSLWNAAQPIDDVDDRETHWSDTPIADELDRKYNR